MRSITQLTMEELTQELLTRPNTDRANLAERLLDSLNNDVDNNDVDNEILNLWSIEANRRLTEFENGTVKGIPGDEALALARQTLKQ